MGPDDPDKPLLLNETTTSSREAHGTPLERHYHSAPVLCTETHSHTKESKTE